MNTFDAENHHVREILTVAYEPYKRLHIPKHALLVTTEIFAFKTKHNLPRARHPKHENIDAEKVLYLSYTGYNE